MNTLTLFALQRLLTGWAIFACGFVLILWLHTFKDHVSHSMIFPLLLLLWIVLGVCTWDACKSLALWKRIVLIFAQAAMAAIACVLLFSHFLYHWP